MVDLKGMTRKNKIEYIWDYYKIHIIVSLIVLIGMISFIHGQITKINYEFNLTIIGGSLDSDKIQKFEDTLTPIVIKNPTAKQSAQIDIMPIASLTSGKDTNSSQYMQKFVAEVSANVIDSVILSKSDFDAFEKQGGFLRLDNVQGIDLSTIKSEKFEGTPDGGEKGIYGISLKDNPLLKNYGVINQDMVLCISSNSKQKEKAILATKWILGYK